MFFGLFLKLLSGVLSVYQRKWFWSLSWTFWTSERVEDDGALRIREEFPFWGVIIIFSIYIYSQSTSVPGTLTRETEVVIFSLMAVLIERMDRRRGSLTFRFPVMVESGFLFMIYYSATLSVVRIFHRGVITIAAETVLLLCSKWQAFLQLPTRLPACNLKEQLPG